MTIGSVRTQLEKIVSILHAAGSTVGTKVFSPHLAILPPCKYASFMLRLSQASLHAPGYVINYIMLLQRHHIVEPTTRSDRIQRIVEVGCMLHTAKCQILKGACFYYREIPRAPEVWLEGGQITLSAPGCGIVASKRYHSPANTKDNYQGMITYRRTCLLHAASSILSTQASDRNHTLTMKHKLVYVGIQQSVYSILRRSIVLTTSMNGSSECSM